MKMKFTFSIFIAMFFAINSSHSQTSPTILSDSEIDCKGKDHEIGTNPSGDKRDCLKACSTSTVKYYTIANAGSTYQWVVTGAVSTVADSNQVIVNWGAIGSGIVKLIETFADNTKDSVSQCIDIIDSPVALFSTAPPIAGGVINVCLLQPVNFTNASVNGTSWHWDFGDGNTFDGLTPPAHSYSLSGSYIISLVVANDCNCTDTFSIKVVVDALPGPDIECPSVVCEGDTSVYTTQAVCSNYDWTVTGGTIISSPINSNTLIVVWGNGASGPGTVTLDVGSCAGFCVVPTTISISIIPKITNISGAIKVCLYSTNTYQMPNIPGTTYSWAVTPGGSITSGQGTNEISVYWDTPETHVVTVDYINNLLDCGGTGKLRVRVLPPFFINGPPDLCANSINASNPFNSNSYSGSVPVNWSVVTPGGATLSNLQTASTVFNTYNWNAGPGTYSVFAVASTGTFCTDTAITTVNVLDTIPQPGVIGPTTICPGGTYQYSAVSTLSDVTFNWTISGGILTPSSGIGSPVTVTWDATGPYILMVSQKMNNAPFCSSEQRVVNIDNLTSPTISGPVLSCINGVSTYTATAIPWYTYNWEITPAGLGSIVSGNGTNTVQVQWLNAAGTASINIAYPQCNTLASTLSNIVITAPPTPTITPSGILCAEGAGINLTSSAAASYIWTNDSNVAFGGNNQTVGITTGGHYNLSVTYSNGCVALNSINVIEAPSPVASISSPAALTYCGAPVPNITLSALTGLGYSFQWLMNGNPISGETNPTYTTNAVGSYNAVVTLGSCSSISNFLLITHNDTCDTVCVTNETVNFTHSTPACNPVNFNGTVSAGIGSRSWNFGDPASGANNFSTSLTPTHTFTNAGFYNVWFTGTGLSADNPPDSCQTGRLITVKIPLVAKFKIHNQCLSDTIFFTNLSTYTSGDPILTNLWNFGDPGSGANNTSTLSSPFHIFSTPGLHTITLTVTNSLCTQTYTLIYNIIDATPVISIAPSPTCINTPINFSSTSTSTLLSWLWNFGDTTSSLLQNVSKTYPSSGTYTVGLNVVDALGCIGTATSSVNLLNAPVPGTIAASGPTTICNGDSVTLTAPAGASFLWSTGDTTQAIVVHEGGSYYATVTNSSGCSYITESIVVNVVPSPTITISGKTNLCDGDYLFLNATNGAAFAYQWLYNNSPITGATFNYYQQYGITVSNSGLYSVIVKDTLTGCSTITSVQVNVNPVPVAPIISIAPSGPYCSGHLYNLTVTNPDNSLSYVWSNGAFGTSLSTSVQGNYTVQAITQYGCKATSNAFFVAPSPDITDVISGCYEFCDTLIPRVIPAPPGYASYQWLQYDALLDTYVTVGTSQYLSVSNAGTFKLVLTNSYGCVDTSANIDVTFVKCTDCEKLAIEFTEVNDNNTENCCWNVGMSNFYSDSLLSAIQINSLNGVGIQYSNLDANWSVQSFNNSSVTIVPNSDTIPFGVNNNLMQLCLNGISDTTQQIVFTWIGQGPDYPVLCEQTINLHCKRDFKCVAVVKDSIYCDGDSLRYSFYIKNYAPYSIQSVMVIMDTLSNVTATPKHIIFPALLPGGIYGPIDIALSGSGLVPGDYFCFTLMSHDSTNCKNSRFCCTDGINHCVKVPPLCNPCDSLIAEGIGSELDCCWEIKLTNNASIDIVGIQTQILSGGGILAINNPIGSGWHINIIDENNVYWTQTNGHTLPTSTMLPQICFDASATGIQVIVVNWLVQGTDNDTIICTDTLRFNCLKDCIGLIEDTITCNDDGTYQYTFAAYNNFTIPIDEFEFIGFTPDTVFVTQPFFTGPIPVDGLLLFSTTLQGNPGDVICFSVKAYEKNGRRRYNCCTTDSIYCIVLPVCDTAVSTDSSLISHQDNLIQNNKKGYFNIAPNPLQNNTKISFVVPVSSDVEFKLYDLRGELISVPFKSFVSGNTEHSFNLNVSGLAKGTYIGLIKTRSGYSVYKKLVVTE